MRGRRRPTPRPLAAARLPRLPVRPRSAAARRQLRLTRSLGTGSSVRVGDIAASTAAQTGALAFVTVDANGTLGRDTATPANIANLQAGLATQGTQIGALFDLADVNRREIREANEGVAMALAMETPMLPPGTTFAVAGGVGYYNHRTAATASFAARVGTNSAFSAGVGVGMNSGEFGARAGFQHAW